MIHTPIHSVDNPAGPSVIPDPVRDLLATVLEAIDLPHAATIGGDEVRVRLLATRATHVRIALRSVLGDDAPDLGVTWDANYLRERLAEHPITGYVTADQADAALNQGKTWSQAVTLPTGESQ
ncbi:hypothetical protein OHB41_34105 [Streptomyces sp. NBC_01571]|uniref:hypothetical protein n=1 Tax=Streptomyces sp. NBC_01571 TaxID=2975883 RepID=UPI002251F8D6|nr:hypothetical protein [Streptomyces sp. NBC_01571]MCX4578137.1 hypothetical protein [Streptomyces sp. NBC_01571]